MTDWWSYFLENHVAKQNKKKTITSGEPGLKSEKKSKIQALRSPNKSGKLQE